MSGMCNYFGKSSLAKCKPILSRKKPVVHLQLKLPFVPSGFLQVGGLSPPAIVFAKNKIK